MDVELADPEPISVDTAILLLALGFVSYGAFRLFTDVGTEGGLMGWVLVAVGWVLVFPRLFLDLELTDEAVEVGVFTGSRRFELADVTEARVVDRWLIVRLAGVSAARYHTGHFYMRGEGRVKGYASRVRGPFVLLERSDDVPVVVSPAEPEAFVREVRSRAGLA